jgi:uncharacterized protein YbjT (DUF2867 family)
VRPGSIRKLPQGVEAVIGDALIADSYCHAVSPGDTFVHLVGVPNPSPLKKAEFRAIDLASALAAADVARARSVAHFVYVSVAQPAPVMRDYVAVRSEAERHVRETGRPLTVLRPWYVLGPRHWWPILLMPLYWFARWIPTWRASAERLGLVTLRSMLGALVHAVETPCVGVRVIEVPEIRES